MKRISRRSFLKVAGVGAAALGLAACGGSKSGSTATSGSASSAAGSSTGSVNTAGFTVQYGPNPETLDPALNSAVDGANTIITITGMTPMRYSATSALKLPRSSPRKSLRTRSPSCPARSMAPFCVQRESLQARTAYGTTSTSFRRNTRFVPALLTLPAECA